MSIKRQGTTIINDQRGLEEISNVTFDTSFTYSAPTEGELIWNTNNPGLEVGLANGVVSRIGETLVTKAKNNQPSNIGKSALVVVVGHAPDGTPLIESWDFLTKSTKNILGICAQTLTAGATGYVVVKGIVSGVNTTGSDYGETWATGDTLYASSASGVSYTNVEPAAPATKTIVAKVAVAHATNGTLEVNIVRSSNLGKDDLVELSSPANGDVLAYNSSTNRFENSSKLKVANASFEGMVDGDYYKAINATHDGTNWNRIDTTKPAWLWQFNLQSQMVFESYRANTLWVCEPGANPINGFTSAGGWYMAHSTSQWKDFTIGGNGIEVDGNFTLPYGRLVHTTYGGFKHSGIMTNVYLDYSGRDDTTKPSFFAGFMDSGSGGESYKIRFAPSGASLNWSDVFSLDNTGYCTINGNTVWTSGNDGANSGLDSDLLDGQHGSHYLDYANFTGTVPTWNQNTTGSAATLTTARTLTVGTTGKTFNGSANVSWTLGEIGAAAASHTHVIDDVTNLASALGGKAPTANPTFTGAIAQNGSVRGNITAVPSLSINCSSGNYFTKTINGTSTFTFSSVPSGAYAFTLELTHTSGAVTWPASVKWPGDTAPTLTTGKTHLFMFVTDDGGTRWRGAALANYVS